MEIKTTVTKIHFALVVLVLLNLIFKLTIHIGLNHDIIFALKFVIYPTGFILFFLNIWPFKKIAIYFSFFILTPFTVFIFLFVHGVFFGLASSLILIPVYPNEIKYNKDDIKIYSKFNGFMNACCTYQITEQKFFLFEKQIGEFKREDISFEKSTLKFDSDSLHITSDNTISVKIQ